MAVRKQGEYWYGDTPADTREVLDRSCGAAKLKVFADAACECGGRVFSLEVDEDCSEAIWTCRECDAAYLFHDRQRGGYFAGSRQADHQPCYCVCGERGLSYFEITVGVELYADEGGDVRRLFVGCRCVDCGLAGCYADWNRVDIPFDHLFRNMQNRLRDS